MRCIIPDVKKKSIFIFGLTFKDILIVTIGLIIEILVIASTFLLAIKFILTIVVLSITIISVIPFDAQRGYELMIGSVNYWTKRHKFGELDLEKELQIKFEDSIQVKGIYTAVIELNGIDFSVLSTSSQNSKILEFMEIIKTVKNGKIIKLEKPLDFEKHIQENNTPIAECEADLAYCEFYDEKSERNDKEKTLLKMKIEALTNQNNAMIHLEDEEKVYRSSFYLLIQDNNKMNTQDLAEECLERLEGIGVCPSQLKGEELKEFMQRFYHNDIKFERETGLKMPAVQEKANKIILNNKSYRIMSVYKYNTLVDNAWAWQLLRLPETKVVINFRPYAGKNVDKVFDKQLLEIRTLLADPKVKDSARSKLEGDLYMLTNLLDDINFGKDKLLDIEFLILYPSEFHKKVMKEFRSNGISMNDMYLSQYEAYLSMFPYLTMNQRKVTSIISMPASSFAAMFPFVVKRLDDDNGIYLGGSSGLPIFFDLFHRDANRMNSNAVVLGKPGGGKSFFMKDLLFNSAIRGKRIFILDPENEYRWLCKTLNGNYIDVSGTRSGRINPLQVFPAFRDKDNDDVLAEVTAHMQFLEQFFKTVIPDIESYSLNVLLDLIRYMYEKRDISDGNDLSKIEPSTYPTFSDLFKLVNIKLEEIEKSNKVTEFEIKSLRILQMEMTKFTDKGIYATLWNGTTTMDISNNFTVMNFQSLFSSSNNVVANAQMLLIVKYLNQEVIKNREEQSNNIIIAIDEAHRFINPTFPVALDFMQQMAKQIRKYFGSLIVTTQNIDDFIGVSMEMKQKAAGVINSCQYSFIFSLLADDTNKIKEMYASYNGGLQDEEVQYIANGRRGDSLFLVDVGTRMPIHITPFSGEEKYFEEPKKMAS